MVKHKLWIDFFGPDFDRERYGYQWKAYLKEVHQDFRKLKLSPGYSGIRELETGFGVFLRNWQATRSGFPKSYNLVDESTLTLSMRNQMQDEITESRVEWFTESIIPTLMQTSTLGKEIKMFIYNQLNLMPVGLESTDRNYGFLLLKNAGEPRTDAYRFYISPLMDRPERLMVHLEKTAEFTYSHSYNFNQMKSELMARCPLLQSTYLIESEINIPMQESIRPLAKKKLVNYLYQGKNPY